MDFLLPPSPYSMNNPSAQQLVYMRKTLKENYELNGRIKANVDKKVSSSFSPKLKKNWSIFRGSIKSYRTETNPFLLIYHFPSCLNIYHHQLSYTFIRIFHDIILAAEGWFGWGHVEELCNTSEMMNNIQFFFYFKFCAISK